MKMITSSGVLTKLANKLPPVSMAEIRECFGTRTHEFLIDNRVKNRTLPPTMWFISDTFMGRQLKVVFIQDTDGTIYIKTAYEPNAEERWIYSRYAGEI